MEEGKSRTFKFNVDIVLDLIHTFDKNARFKKTSSGNGVRGLGATNLKEYEFDFYSSDIFLIYVARVSGGVMAPESNYSATLNYSTGDDTKDVGFVISELERLAKSYE